MKLYSFQRMHVWDNLNQLGYYHPFSIFEYDDFLKEDSQHNWGFTHAYLWLKNAMLDKGIHFTANNDHMIWAWYQWAGKNRKQPDKRYASVYDYFKDEPYVLMELDIDPSRVLLSDYDLWHWVLNRHPAMKRREDQQFSKKYNFNYSSKDNLSDEGTSIMENSWNNIFDLSLARDIIEVPQKNQQIQATFFELFYTDVKKVHFFDNKKCTQILNLKD